MADKQPQVLVVGGGPAGACAARAAAEAGARVLLIEAKRRLGSPPHCAEYVPRLLTREVEFPARSVAWPVENMVTRLSDQTINTAAPGYILDRDRFDRGLAEAAASAGAEIRVGIRLIRIDGPNLIVRGPRGEETVTPDVVVAADGAASGLRRLAGRPTPKRLTGVQMQVPLVQNLNHTLVLFNPAWRYGYAWLFPKETTANLGLGFLETAPGQAWAALEELSDSLQEERLIKAGSLSRSVGAIVVEGPYYPLAEHELFPFPVLFAGDAAGLTHPITGAGIPQAVISGQSAGRAAAGYVRSGDTDEFNSYEREMKSRFGRTLNQAGQKRAWLESNWDEGRFIETIKRTWPAFREYWIRD